MGGKEKYNEVGKKLLMAPTLCIFIKLNLNFAERPEPE